MKSCIQRVVFASMRFIIPFAQDPLHWCSFFALWRLEPQQGSGSQFLATCGPILHESNKLGLFSKGSYFRVSFSGILFKARRGKASALRTCAGHSWGKYSFELQTRAAWRSIVTSPICFQNRFIPSPNLTASSSLQRVLLLPSLRAAGRAKRAEWSSPSVGGLEMWWVKTSKCANFPSVIDVLRTLTSTASAIGCNQVGSRPDIEKSIAATKEYPKAWLLDSASMLVSVLLWQEESLWLSCEGGTYCFGCRPAGGNSACGPALSLSQIAFLWTPLMPRGYRAWNFCRRGSTSKNQRQAFVLFGLCVLEWEAGRA